MVIQPAEWETHEAVWLAWPSDETLWKDNLKPAQNEFVAFCRAITKGGGERLEILVPGRPHENAARLALSGIEGTVRYHHIPFGDIWLRDTAPIFVRASQEATVRAAIFRFNGWGGKYMLEHDNAVAATVARASGAAAIQYEFVLEGGSIDVDGLGTGLTTRQCLLHPNRNPGMSQPELETAIRRALGIQKLLWLGNGLLNDHTDGHVDTIARFVSPGTVVCMAPSGDDDPNREVLEAIAEALSSFTDARGQPLRVERVPSPGLVTNNQGEVLPASYVNFYVGNRSVIVPTYGSRWDAPAVEAISRLFNDRKTVGLSARAILSGGGAFHCITQQQPQCFKPGR